MAREPAAAKPRENIIKIHKYFIYTSNFYYSPVTLTVSFDFTVVSEMSCL
jgi:hypothetical protein